MNKLTTEKRAAIIRGLVEGGSLRAVARMVGVNRETVGKVLCEVGEFAETYQRYSLTNLRKTTRVELDEIWSFVGAKESTKTRPEHGDLWTFTAICADSKLVFSWLVASRTSAATHTFAHDVKRRLPNRVQLSSDANHAYIAAVESAFGWNGCDFGQLVKKFASDPKGPRRGKMAPPREVISVEKSIVFGRPDVSLISTAYVERQNLTMRMHMRRFTRLTNGYSKKAQNHAFAVALHYLVYNYVRPHGTLTKAANGTKTTPAMAAGIASRPWSVEQIVHMLDGSFLIGQAA